jgi:hypothetical protein
VSAVRASRIRLSNAPSDSAARTSSIAKVGPAVLGAGWPPPAPDFVAADVAAEAGAGGSPRYASTYDIAWLAWIDMLSGPNVEPGADIGMGICIGP